MRPSSIYLVGGIQVPLVPLTNRPECVTAAYALHGNHCTFGNSRTAGLYDRTSFLPSRFMTLCFARSVHCLLVAAENAAWKNAVSINQNFDAASSMRVLVVC